MARIILSVLFLVVLVILIVMNVGSVSSVNVFGWVVEEVPVTVVGLVCFVSGVVYSFIFYLMSYLERGRRNRLDKRKKKLKDQEAVLKSREQEVGERETTKRQLEQAKAQGAARAGLFSNLFGRGKRPEEAVSEPVQQTAEEPAKPKKKK